MVVLRSRRRAENETAYSDEAVRIGDIARTMPGYISHTWFRAPDGENVTIVEFETMGDVEAWGRHPDHQAAKARPRRPMGQPLRAELLRVRLRPHGPRRR